MEKRNRINEKEFCNKYHIENENYFKYSVDTLQNKIEENDVDTVCMRGVMDELLNLKSIIEKLYEENIFYLTYWKSEAPFHGWFGEESRIPINNQAKITEGITDSIQNVYALILAGIYGK